MKTLIGIVTFGNTGYTNLAIKAVRETTTKPYELYVVVGKPGDEDTPDLLDGLGIEYEIHQENRGFPASVNCIYDRAWKTGDFDNVIIMGNDVVPYPEAIDSLIQTAEETDYEWICSREYDVRALLREYPAARVFFEAPDYKLKDFNTEPWKLARRAEYRHLLLDGAGLSDCRNLTLFKKSVFDKIGYADEGFHTNGYFEDNDYVRRAILAGISSCTVHNSVYFHFWSRTRFTVRKSEEHNKSFLENKEHYLKKWGGEFLHETFPNPFNNPQNTLKIGDF